METHNPNSHQTNIQHETLHDDLLVLSGDISPSYQCDVLPDFQRNHYFRFDKGQVDHVSDAIHSWLPQKITELGGDSNAIFEPKGKYVFSRSQGGESVEYTSWQMYGHSPTPEQIKVGGPIIEVGGPSRPRNSMIGNYGARPDFITNVRFEAGELGYVGKIDAIADTTKLPFADKSIGAVFASCLPGRRRNRNPTDAHVRPMAIVEADRVLMPGGRLFWGGGTQADFDEILAIGFIPESIVVTICNEEDLATGLFAMPSYSVNGTYIKG